MADTIINKNEDSIRWGYLTAFVLLLVSYILTFYSTQQVSKQQERLHHTNEVIYTLDILSSELISTESAARGYVIMKNEKFLNDYYKSPKLIDSTYSRLKLLTSDNQLQQNRLDTLQLLIKKKLSILSTGLQSFKNNNLNISDSLLTLGYVGKLAMDSIKIITKKIQEEENNLTLQRSNRANTFSNFIQVFNVTSFVLAIVLAIYSIAIFNKEKKAKREAFTKAEQLREQLQIRINELDTLNKELVELRSVEKFVATGRISRTIAHEVRNPLTNINLATDHLRSEIQPGSETQILFDMISRNSNRINELINDLLNSTKAAHLNFTKADINDVLETSLGFVQDRIDLKAIKVVRNYSAAPLLVLADVEKLNIAFLNIILNAVEAIDSPNGMLIISTEEKNNRCVVTISDNGKGIDKESLSKLFEPYFTTKQKGTGLGLTNTQNIILGHHGNIHLESEPGKGTSFIIMFNCA